jgi:hypothetical protein
VPSELQRIADTLGRRLSRAVAIDNPCLRLLVYSPHFGPVDDVRLACLLHREAPREVTNWVLAQGIADATGPVRLPPKPEISLQSRVSIPIRCHGVLLGYLWLIDADNTLTDEDLVLARSAADAAGAELYRERLSDELNRDCERELLRDLLSDAMGVRSQAADELIERNLFVPATETVVLAVQPVFADGTGPDEGLLLSMDLALDQLRRRLSPRHTLHLMRPDHGVFVAAVKDPVLQSGNLMGLGESLYEILEQNILSVNPVSIFVGIGGVHRLSDLVLSYREARRAVHIAQIEHRFGRVVAWDALGIYRLLSQFPVEQLVPEALHPGLLDLFRSDEAAVLIPTLERYLDCGCNAQESARDLSLHRASLYYRLHKIEEIAGVDLHSGEDRLVSIWA